MDTKALFVEKAWDYFGGYSTGTVTTAEVRRAPYHRRIKNLASDTKELAEIDLRQLHSRGWRSRVTVYDLHTDGRLPRADTCECTFNQTSVEYHTWELEELRSRVLETSVPYSGRLVVAENLLPPVLEIIGSSFRVDPELFGQHVGNAWGDRSNSINASSAQSPGWTGSWLDFRLRHPRLVAVSHPTALKPRYPEWRGQCLKRGARFLQCRQLLPILDTIDEREPDKIQCIAFEHITASFKLHARNDADRGWEGLVLFPNSFRDWKDGKFKVDRPNIGPRANVRLMQDKLKVSEEASKDPDVDNWLAALRLLSDDEEQSLNPFNILELLWREVLDHWQLHLAQIASVVEILSSGSAEVLSELGLTRQQQLRAVIVQGISILSDIDDSLRIAGQMCSTNATLNRPSVGVGLEDLRNQFLHVKTQLERHGPSLEHHIGIITLEQQRRLAETQLEESRKAIQQADTIKRLTILAFIYIPIQTASAVFGMNLKELQPSPSVWVFIVVAVVLLAMTLSAAGWHHILSFLYRQHYKIFGSFRHMLGDALATLGINVDRLQRNETLDARKRTPEPSWYHEPPWD